VASCPALDRGPRRSYPKMDAPSLADGNDPWSGPRRGVLADHRHGSGRPGRRSRRRLGRGGDERAAGRRGDCSRRRGRSDGSRRRGRADRSNSRARPGARPHRSATAGRGSPRPGFATSHSRSPAAGGCARGAFPAARSESTRGAGPRPDAIVAGRRPDAIVAGRRPDAIVAGRRSRAAVREPVAGDDGTGQRVDRPVPGAVRRRHPRSLAGLRSDARRRFRRTGNRPGDRPVREPTRSRHQCSGRRRNPTT
jgi:hypothetical protein